jgi:uncharacterized membrane protein YgdD (TMEM256/DUF423 family)
MTKNSWLQAIGLLGAVAVATGAFGAHSLRDQVSPERLATWHTGSRYLMWHVLGMLAIVLSQKDLNPWRWVLRSWLTGSLIFSGSLFALVILNKGWLGAITPAGGILLICGWVIIFRTALLNKFDDE